MQTEPSPAGSRLSFSQERFKWFEEHGYDSTIYNLRFGFRAIGELSIPALEKTLSEIIARHELLRTNVAQSESGFVQRVLPPEPIQLAITDIGPFEDQPIEHRIKQALETLPPERMSILSGRLWRFQLLRLAPDDHILLAIFHHAALDFVSVLNLFRELTTIYGLSTQAVFVRPSPLQVQYRDFAEWERARIEGPEGRRQLSYWLDQVASAPLLRLPIVNPVRKNGVHGGEMRYRMLTSHLEELRKLARRARTSSFTILLAILFVVLNRFSAQEDIVVASSFVNRERIEFLPLIGPLANTLPIRVKLDSRLPLIDFISSVKYRVLGAIAHQQLPGEKLFETLLPERNLLEHPLFSVTLTHHSAAELEPRRSSGVNFSLITLGSDVSKCDWEFFATETRREAWLALHYDSDLFDFTIAEEALALYECVLQRALENPRLPLVALPTRVDLL